MSRIQRAVRAEASDCSYLNDGGGEPCTGQTRVQAWDCSGDRWGSIKLDLLGAELPMGSSKSKVRLQLHYYKCWDGRSAL